MSPRGGDPVEVDGRRVDAAPRPPGWWHPQWWLRPRGWLRRDPGSGTDSAGAGDVGAGNVVAPLILTLLVLLAFSPWWLSGRLIAPLDLLDGLYEPWRAAEAPVSVYNHFTSDAVTQYLVYRRVAERSLAEDGGVGWSELTQGGRPEYANTMALYDDWSMQLHRFFDFWTAWHLGLLGQFLIAGLGMWLFLRGERISPAVALVGAIAFAANSQFIFYLYHRWHLGAFAWVPWVAWAVQRHRFGRRWGWPLVPVFLALAFLGGSLQTSVFVGLVMVGLWLGWLFERQSAPRPGGPVLIPTGPALMPGRSMPTQTSPAPTPTDPAPTPSNASPSTSSPEPPVPPSSRWSITGHFLAWGVLGAGLAAFALYPNALTLAEGLELGIDRGQIGYANGWRQPFFSLLFLVFQPIPSLLGSPRSMDLTKALGLELHDIAYFGLIPMVLAIRAAFMRRAPAAARWLIGLGLLLPLTPLVGPLYHRVQLVFCFGGAWAFAWYLEAMRSGSYDPILRKSGTHDPILRRSKGHDPVLRRIGLLGLAFVALWLVGSLASVLLEGVLQPRIDAYITSRIATGQAGQFGSYREEWLLDRGRRLLAELRIWHPRQLVAVFMAVAGSAALWLRGRGARRAIFLLLAAVTVELGAFAGSWATVVDPVEHPPYAESPDIAALRELAGTGIGAGRVYIVDDPVAPSFFPPNTLAMYGIATIQAYESVGFRSMWSEAGYTTDPVVLGGMGVTHAVARPGVELGEGWGAVYRGERLVVWENVHALPRYLATLGGAGSPAGRESAALRRALVQVSGTQNHRLLEVPPGTTTIRVAENWGEGWQYRVEWEGQGDGQGSGRAGEGAGSSGEGSSSAGDRSTGWDDWRPVGMAEDRSMLLALGSAIDTDGSAVEEYGSARRVEMRYRPTRRRVGWWLTFTSAILLVAAYRSPILGPPRG